MFPNWIWKPFVHVAVTGHWRALRLRPLDPPRPSGLPTVGLYLHVPFCKSLCPFCPYHRLTYEESAYARFERAVKEEIDLCADGLAGSRVSSLYVGGGTPTVDRDGLLRICEHLHSKLPRPDDTCIELHPSHMDRECLNDLRSAGATQISIGVESVFDQTLRRLGRSHDRCEALSAMDRAVRVGFDSINVDLMFAIPGQTLHEWDQTVRATLASGVDQLSTYPLFSFPYSDLGRDQGINKVARPPTRLVLQMLARTEEVAQSAGFERCAVWSWRRPGKKKFSSITRHHYVGFGPSAASMTGGHFYVNTFDLNAYTSHLPRRRPVAVGAALSRRFEMAYWLYWRIYELHVDGAAFRQTFGGGESLERRFGHVLNSLCFLGLMKREDGGYSVTRPGAFWIHRLQNEFSLNYINRLWGTCRAQAWPSQVSL